MRCVHSFVRRITRRMLMPQICAVAGVVAKRLEGNRHLDRPPALESSRAHVPHRVPVDVEIAFVGDRLVGARAERVGVEEVAVPAIVERVEDHAEGIVLAKLGRVAPQLVGNPPLGRRRIPAARGNVDVAAVEHHPGFGPFSRGCALSRYLLNEITGRLHLLVHRFVELSVHLQRFIEPDGPDGRTPGCIARHRGGCERRRRTVDHGSTGTDSLPGQRLSAHRSRTHGHQNRDDDHPTKLAQCRSLLTRHDC